MTRIKTILLGSIIAILLLAGLWEAFKWSAMRIYVPQDQALMVINKFGDSLPPELIAVPQGQNHYKGVEEELLGPGRYFINPVEYSTQTVALITIGAGDPSKWEWDADGHIKDPNTLPMIGLVSCKQGKTPPPGVEVVDPGFKGIQRDVLTPGTYKINTYLYEVTPFPAVVVPPGSVGVLTRLEGDVGEVKNVTLSEIRANTTGPTTQGTIGPVDRTVPSRLVTGANQRGIERDVLQPGIYYKNPRIEKVDVVPVGYDQISLEEQNGIKFNSSDGYEVQAGFTVVWGRSPADAPTIVANIGNVKAVEDKVITPAMKSACENVGAKYSAQQLIQGSTRSQFQDALSASLENQVKTRNVHVLLALIRNINVKDITGANATDGLLATIQRANIEVERDLTLKQKTQTAITKAKLEETLKGVDIAHQTVESETGVKVANLMADSAKKAAEIDAQRQLDVASIALEMAKLDAQRIQILGKAEADVQQLKSEAEAKGAKLLVDAFGSPQAYNLYTFAQNFAPTDIRFIFAGPGTFWTDLRTPQDTAAFKILQHNAEESK